MGTTIEYEPLALFGKRGGGDDYAWLQGREAVCPELSALATDLAAYSSASRTRLAAVGLTGGAIWVAVSTLEGPDSAGRTVVGVHVVTLLSPAPLERARWIDLCLAAHQLVRSPANCSLDGRHLDVGVLEPASRVPEDTLWRGLLGLPLSIGPAEGASLLGRLGSRFSAVVFAATPTSRAWSDGSARMLLVNLPCPPLGDRGRTILAHAHEIGLPDWAIERLSSLAPSSVADAVCWTRDVLHDRARLPVSPSNPIAEWVAAFRRNQLAGTTLLSTLRADFGSTEVPDTVVKIAWPGLGEGARRVVTGSFHGMATRIGQEQLEQVARSGLLDSNLILPFSAWAQHAAASPVIAETAIARVMAMGVDRPNAEFLLDLPCAPASPSLQPLDVIADAWETLELPTPRRNLTTWLNNCLTDADLAQFAFVARRFGGWGRAVTDVAVGHDWFAKELDVQDVAVAVRARCRVEGSWVGLIEALANLLKVGPPGSAPALLRECDTDPGGRLPSVVRAALQTKFLGTEPAAVRSAIPLLPLFDSGLFDPGDVEPVDAAALLELASRWPETAALANPIRGVGEVPECACPDSWLRTLRAAVTPSSAGRWLQTLPERMRGRAVAWLDWLTPSEAFSKAFGQPGERVMNGAHQETLAAAVEWVQAVGPSLARDRRLTALRVFGSAEPRLTHEGCESVATAVLPDEPEPVREVALCALSGIGPIPSLEGVPADLLAALLPLVDPVELVDAVMRVQDSRHTEDAALVRLIASRAAQGGSNAPRRGYSVRQLRRHARLATALRDIAGWALICTMASEIALGSDRSGRNDHT